MRDGEYRVSSAMNPVVHKSLQTFNLQYGVRWGKISLRSKQVFQIKHNIGQITETTEISKTHAEASGYIWRTCRDIIWIETVPERSRLLLLWAQALFFCCSSHCVVPTGSNLITASTTATLIKWEFGPFAFDHSWIQSDGIRNILSPVDGFLIHTGSICTTY